MMKKRILHIALAGFVGVASMANIAFAEDAQKFSKFKDYTVTVGFIYNLLKNVEWPAEVKSKGDKVTVCTVSSNPVDQVPVLLKKIAGDPKYKVSMRVVDNVDYTNKAVLNECAVVYISSFDGGRVEDVLKATQGSPIMTVSELRNFAKRGGMVGFVIEDGEDSVLQVNVTSLKKANIELNAGLLQLAQLFN